MPEHQIQNNFLNLSGEEPIYRVFGLTWFFDMFQNQHNVLVKPKLWDDPFENFILNAAQYLRSGEKGTLTFKDYVFGQCWSLLDESDAMWRIYSPNKDGVKVQTTVRTLCSSLYDQVGIYRDLSVFIGRVEYKEEPDLRRILNSTDFVLNSDGTGIAKALLLKRREFEHEREVRLIFSDAEQKCTDDKFKYSIQPSQLFSEITFDPRMSDVMFDIYKEHLTRIGFRGSVVKSSLYRLEHFRGRLNI